MDIKLYKSIVRSVLVKRYNWPVWKAHFFNDPILEEYFEEGLNEFEATEKLYKTD